MDITFAEKDLADAVRLYLAYSGITRTVVNVDFARKLRGDDAGIMATFELSDQPLDPAMLANLAMERKRALAIENNLPITDNPDDFVAKAVTAPQSAAKQPIKTTAKARSAPPAETPAEPVSEAPAAKPKTVAEVDPAPLATPEELGADNPFGMSDDDEPEETDTPVDATDNDAVPENSPFADMATASEAPEPETKQAEAETGAEDEDRVDYSHNPFDEPVTPIDDDVINEITQEIADETTAQEPEEEMSLFG